MSRLRKLLRVSFHFRSAAGLPDSFAKVSVDGTGQVYTTDPYKSSLDPKWNTHYDLYLGRGDGITITVYNQKKIHKKQGFLGCVRIVASTIQRLKDTGCKCAVGFRECAPFDC